MKKKKKKKWVVFGVSFMDCLIKTFLYEMVYSFPLLYPMYIHAIRKAALEYCKEHRISGLAELHDVRYGMGYYIDDICEQKSKEVEKQGTTRNPQTNDDHHHSTEFSELCSRGTHYRAIFFCTCGI